jgi:hypothetical protein
MPGPQKRVTVVFGTLNYCMKKMNETFPPAVAGGARQLRAKVSLAPSVHIHPLKIASLRLIKTPSNAKKVAYAQYVG